MGTKMRYSWSKSLWMRRRSLRSTKKSHIDLLRRRNTSRNTSQAVTRLKSSRFVQQLNNSFVRVRSCIAQREYIQQAEKKLRAVSAQIVRSSHFLQTTRPSRTTFSIRTPFLKKAPRGLRPNSSSYPFRKTFLISSTTAVGFGIKGQHAATSGTASGSRPFSR